MVKRRRIDLREAILPQRQIFDLTGIDLINLQNWANRGLINPHRPLRKGGILGRRRYSLADAAKVKLAMDLVSMGLSASNANYLASSAVDGYVDADRGGHRDREKYPDPVKHRLVVVPRHYSYRGASPTGESDTLEACIFIDDQPGWDRVKQRSISYDEFVRAAPTRIEIDVTRVVETIIHDFLEATGGA